MLTPPFNPQYPSDPPKPRVWEKKDTNFSNHSPFPHPFISLGILSAISFNNRVACVCMIVRKVKIKVEIMIKT